LVSHGGAPAGFCHVQHRNACFSDGGYFDAEVFVETSFYSKVRHDFLSGSLLRSHRSNSSVTRAATVVLPRSKTNPGENVQVFVGGGGGVGVVVVLPRPPGVVRCQVPVFPFPAGIRATDRIPPCLLSFPCFRRGNLPGVCSMLRGSVHRRPLPSEASRQRGNTSTRCVFVLRVGYRFRCSSCMPFGACCSVFVLRFRASSRQAPELVRNRAGCSTSPPASPRRGTFARHDLPVTQPRFRAVETLSEALAGSMPGVAPVVGDKDGDDKASAAAGDTLPLKYTVMSTAAFLLLS